MSFSTVVIRCLLILGLSNLSPLTKAAEVVIPSNCKEISAAEIGLTEGKTTNNIKMRSGEMFLVRVFNCAKTYALEGHSWSGAYSAYLLSWYTATGQQDEFFLSDPKEKDNSGVVDISFHKVDDQTFIIDEYEERGGYAYVVHHRERGKYAFLKQRYTSGDEDGVCFAKAKNSSNKVIMRRCYWDEKSHRTHFFGKRTVKIDIQPTGLKVANPKELKYFEDWDYITRRKF